jgi:hypothetical protein
MPFTAQTPLERLIEALAGCFTPDVARRVAGFRVDAETEARIGELASKANEGQLTADEDAEYRQFIEAMDFVGILQARAREMASATKAG